MKKFIRIFSMYFDRVDEGRRMAVLYDHKEKVYVLVGMHTAEQCIKFNTNYELIQKNYS